MHLMLAGSSLITPGVQLQLICIRSCTRVRDIGRQHRTAPVIGRLTSPGLSRALGCAGQVSPDLERIRVLVYDTCLRGFAFSCTYVYRSLCANTTLLRAGTQSISALGAHTANALPMTSPPHVLQSRCWAGS